MKLAYSFTRRQFGKVLTPLKGHSARLPLAFGLFYAKIGKLDKSRFCRPRPLCSSMNEAKFDVLYRSSALFSDRERAAPDYVAELTKEKKLPPDTFSRLSRYDSERQICVWSLGARRSFTIGCAPPGISLC